MSGFFGLVRHDDGALSNDAAGAASAAMSGWLADRTEMAEGPGYRLIMHRRHATPESHCAVPLPRQNGDLILFDGRLDNRRLLSRRLGIAETESDDAFVKAAWERFDKDFVHHLLGDFAIAVVSPATRRVVLARDHIGTRPLFFTTNGALTAFASSLRPLRALPWVDDAWDRVWLADYLQQVNADPERTAYRSIRALHAAHVLDSDDRREGAPRRYWSLPTHTDWHDASPDEAYAQVAELLEEAVACRLRVCGPAASELSGGLDSGAIATLAAEQLAPTGQSLIAITQAAPPDAERSIPSRHREDHLATELCLQHANIEQWLVSNSEDRVARELARSIRLHGAPQRRDFGGFSGEAFARARAAGVSSLLSGFGGDQLVSSHIFGFRETLWAERDFRTWRAVMAQKTGATGAWARYFHRLLFSPPQVDVALNRARTTAVGSADLLSEAGYPERMQAHPLIPSGSTHREREARLLSGPTLPLRLQDSAIGAGAHGIDYRYPLLDIRLLEYVHNLPTRLRGAPDAKRLPLRIAMRRRMPDSIRLRQDKSGMAIPGVVANLDRQAKDLLDIVEEHAGDPLLADLLNFEPVRRALRSYLDNSGGLSPEAAQETGRASRVQVLRVALVCLWASEDGAGDLGDAPGDRSTIGRPPLGRV